MPHQIQFQEQKVTEAASILLQLAGGRMAYLKLLKLLYLADRAALDKWDRPISYDSYVSMDYGPVLSNTYDLIKGSHPNGHFWSGIIEKCSPNDVQLKGSAPKIRKLSQAEIEVITAIFEKYGALPPFTLAKLTHQLPEYKDPSGSSLPISIKDILRALGRTSEEIELIVSELNEEANIDAMFGG